MENRWLVARGWGSGKQVKLSVIKISSEDLVWNMVTIANHTVLYTCKLLRVDLKCSHHTHTVNLVK